MNDSALAVALTRNDIAHRSVQALLDDADHVVTVIQPEDRAEAACAVLSHHEPPVDESLLSNEGRALQAAARRLLAAIADDEIRPDDLERLTAPAPSTPAPPLRPTRSLPSGPIAPVVETEIGASDVPARQPRAPRRVVGVLTGATVTVTVATASFAIGSLLARIL